MRRHGSGPVREGLEGEFQADGSSRPTQLIQGRSSDLAALDAAELALRHPGGGRRDPLAETRGESRQVDLSCDDRDGSLASVPPRCDLRPAIDEVSLRRLI